MRNPVLACYLPEGLPVEEVALEQPALVQEKRRYVLVKGGSMAEILDRISNRTGPGTLPATL